MYVCVFINFDFIETYNNYYRLPSRQCWTRWSPLTPPQVLKPFPIRSVIKSVAKGAEIISKTSTFWYNLKPTWYWPIKVSIKKWKMQQERSTAIFSSPSKLPHFLAHNPASRLPKSFSCTFPPHCRCRRQFQTGSTFPCSTESHQDKEHLWKCQGFSISSLDCRYYYKPFSNILFWRSWFRNKI